MKPSLIMRDVLRKSARNFLPVSLFQPAAQAYNRFRCKHGVHPDDYERFIALLYGDQGSTEGSMAQVRINNLQHPLYVRPGTPDAEEIVHSGIREAYGMYLPEGDVKFIVDAGAYIGDTTCWYLSKFPSSRIVALEPTPETFAMLEANCAPYGSRVRIINGALWVEDGELDLILNSSTPTGIFVAQNEMGGNKRCTAFSLSTIMKQAQVEEIDILKLDIEGAELQLFSMNPDPWLGRTRYIAIEIHSPEAYAAVHAATKRHGFFCRRYRELYLYFKKSPK